MRLSIASVQSGEPVRINLVPIDHREIAPSLRRHQRAGQVERWRLINTASAPLRLSLGGQPLHLIRTDDPPGQAVDEVLM